METHIAVVVPVYKTPLPYLTELAVSLAREPAPGDVVLWVDDGSPDPSGFDALEARLRGQPAHQFLRLGRNFGVAGAMNLGIAAVRDAELIITIGSDDAVQPGYLEAGRALFMRRLDLEIVVPRIQLFGDDERIIDPGPNPFRFHRILRGNRIPAAAMFRRRLWERLGGFDEDLRMNFEDWDFWVRAKLAGAPFARLHVVGIRYRVRADSISRAIPRGRARTRLWARWLVPILRSVFALRPWPLRARQNSAVTETGRALSNAVRPPAR